MNSFRLQVRWQVDDLNRFKGALLHAYTATDAERFIDLRRLVSWSHFDTQLSHSNDGACFFTLLAALLRFALVKVDDSDTRLLRLKNDNKSVRSIYG